MTTVLSRKLVSIITLLLLLVAYVNGQQIDCQSGFDTFREPGTTNARICIDKSHCTADHTCEVSTLNALVKVCCKATSSSSSSSTTSTGTPQCKAGQPYCVPGATAPLLCLTQEHCPSPYTCDDSTVAGKKVCCSKSGTTSGTTQQVAYYQQPTYQQPTYQQHTNLQPQMYGSCPAGTSPAYYPGTTYAQGCCCNAVYGSGSVYNCPAGSQCYQLHQGQPEGICCCTNSYRGWRRSLKIVNESPYGVIKPLKPAHCPFSGVPQTYDTQPNIYVMCNEANNATACNERYFCHVLNKGEGICCPQY